MGEESWQAEELSGRYKRKLRQAEGLYQAVWAVWALAYGLCWMVSDCHLNMPSATKDSLLLLLHRFTPPTLHS